MQSDSGNINFEGINIDNSQAAYVDLITKKGNLETAAQAMAGDIRTAIQTQTLTVSEKVQLMGVLTEIVGDAELAEAYVEANTMDMQQGNQENAITDTLYEEEETGYNEEDNSSSDDNDAPTKPNVAARLINSIKDATMVARIKELRSVFTGKYKEGNFGYAEVSIDGIDIKELYAHSKIHTLAQIENKQFAQEVDNICRKYSEEESLFKVLWVNPELIVDGPGAYPRNFDTEAKILETLARLLDNNYYVSGKIKIYTELPPCPSCIWVIEQFNIAFPNIIVEVIHSNGEKL